MSYYEDMANAAKGNDPQVATAPGVQPTAAQGTGASEPSYYERMASAGSAAAPSAAMHEQAASSILTVPLAPTPLPDAKDEQRADEDLQASYADIAKKLTGGVGGIAGDVLTVPLKAAVGTVVEGVKEGKKRARHFNELLDAGYTLEQAKSKMDLEKRLPSLTTKLPKWEGDGAKFVGELSKNPALFTGLGPAAEQLYESGLPTAAIEITNFIKGVPAMFGVAAGFPLAEAEKGARYNLTTNLSKIDPRFAQQRAIKGEYRDQLGFLYRDPTLSGVAREALSKSTETDNLLDATTFGDGVAHIDVRKVSHILDPKAPDFTSKLAKLGDALSQYEAEQKAIPGYPKYIAETAWNVGKYQLQAWKRLAQDPIGEILVDPASAALNILAAVSGSGAIARQVAKRAGSVAPTVARGAADVARGAHDVEVALNPVRIGRRMFDSTLDTLTQAIGERVIPATGSSEYVAQFKASQAKMAEGARKAAADLRESHAATMARLGKKLQGAYVAGDARVQSEVLSQMRVAEDAAKRDLASLSQAERLSAKRAKKGGDVIVNNAGQFLTSIRTKWLRAVDDEFKRLYGNAIIQARDTALANERETQAAARAISNDLRRQLFDEGVKMDYWTRDEAGRVRAEQMIQTVLDTLGDVVRETPTTIGANADVAQLTQSLRRLSDYNRAFLSMSDEEMAAAKAADPIVARYHDAIMANVQDDLRAFTADTVQTLFDRTEEAMQAPGKTDVARRIGIMRNAKMADATNAAQSFIDLVDNPQFMREFAPTSEQATRLKEARDLAAEHLGAPSDVEIQAGSLSDIDKARINRYAREIDEANAMLEEGEAPTMSGAEFKQAINETLNLAAVYRTEEAFAQAIRTIGNEMFGGGALPVEGAAERVSKMLGAAEKHLRLKPGDLDPAKFLTKMQEQAVATIREHGSASVYREVAEGVEAKGSAVPSTLVAEALRVTEALSPAGQEARGIMQGAVAEGRRATAVAAEAAMKEAAADVAAKEYRLRTTGKATGKKIPKQAFVRREQALLAEEKYAAARAMWKDSILRVEEATGLPFFDHPLAKDAENLLREGIATRKMADNTGRITAEAANRLERNAAALLRRVATRDVFRAMMTRQRLLLNEGLDGLMQRGLLSKDPSYIARATNYLPDLNAKYEHQNILAERAAITDIGKTPNASDRIRRSQNRVSAERAVHNMSALYNNAIDDISRKIAEHDRLNAMQSIGRERGAVFDVAEVNPDVAYSHDAERLYGSGVFKRATQQDIRNAYGTRFYEAVFSGNAVDPQAAATGAVRRFVSKKAPGLMPKVSFAEGDVAGLTRVLEDARITEYYRGPDGRLYVHLPDDVKRYGDMAGRMVKGDLAAFNGLASPEAIAKYVKDLEPIYLSGFFSKGYSLWKGMKTVAQLTTLMGNLISNAYVMNLTPTGRRAMARLQEAQKLYAEFRKTGAVRANGTRNPIADIIAYGADAGFMRGEIPEHRAVGGMDVEKTMHAIQKTARYSEMSLPARVLYDLIVKPAKGVYGSMASAYTSSELIFKSAAAMQFADELAEWARFSGAAADNLAAAGWNRTTAIEALDDVAARGAASKHYQPLVDAFGARENGGEFLHALRTGNDRFGGALELLADDPQAAAQMLREARDGAHRLGGELVDAAKHRTRLGVELADKLFFNYEKVSGLLEGVRKNPLLGSVFWSPFLTWTAKMARLAPEFIAQNPVQSALAMRVTQEYMHQMAKHAAATSEDEFNAMWLRMPQLVRARTLPLGMDTPEETSAVMKMSGGYGMRLGDVSRVTPLAPFVTGSPVLAAGVPSWLDEPMFVPDWLKPLAGQNLATTIAGVVGAAKGTDVDTGTIRRTVWNFLAPNQLGSTLDAWQAAQKGEAQGKYGSVRTPAEALIGSILPLSQRHISYHMQVKNMQAEIAQRAAKIAGQRPSPLSPEYGAWAKKYQLAKVLVTRRFVSRLNPLGPVDTE